MPTDPPTIQPYQQRVIDERREANEKLVALGAFFGTAPYAALSGYEQSLMHRQHRIMQEYIAVLDQRLGVWNLATA